MIRHIKIAFVAWFFPDDLERDLERTIAYINETLIDDPECLFSEVRQGAERIRSGLEYAGEVEDLWDQEWQARAPLSSIFTSAHGLQALSLHDIDAFVGKQSRRPVLEVALAGRASSMMFRAGTHRPYSDWLLNLAAKLEAEYMFAGNSEMLSRYVKNAIKGTLTPPLNQPIQGFLPEFGILPAAMVPTGVDLTTFGMARADQRQDGSWIIDMWPDHTWRQGNPYDPVAEALGLASLFRVPDPV